VAQHDYIIANQSGAAFRADLNNGLAAIVSQNSGATQPSTTYAYQWWADTTTGLLKIRNAANNAWITVGTLADTNFGLLPAAGGTMTGNLTLNAQSDLRLADSDSSNWVALQAPATVASNVTWTLPATDGTADQTLATNGTGTLEWGTRARLVRGTAVAATSGTSIDFTGIPSWAKRITVILDGVSTATATTGQDVCVQLGDSGGVETTGYLAYVSTVYFDSAATTPTSLAASGGFPIFFGTTGAIRSGTITLVNPSGNLWVATVLVAVANGTGPLYGSCQGGGTKTLSGTLDRVRLTTLTGVDTFDAGTVNIIYEG
jgi:hypothetical protein